MKLHKPVVYFAQFGSGGPIKIGFSSNAAKRLGNLDFLWDEVRILATMSCARDATLEAKLHAQFAAEHLRREWFHPSPRLMAFIETLEPWDAEAAAPGLPFDKTVLRQWREAMKWSHKKAATFLGISPAKLRKWESEPSRHSLALEWALLRHIKWAPGENLVCMVCAQAFSNAGQLIRHRKKVHPDEHRVSALIDLVRPAYHKARSLLPPPIPPPRHRKTLLIPETIVRKSRTPDLCAILDEWLSKEVNKLPPAYRKDYVLREVDKLLPAAQGRRARRITPHDGHRRLGRPRRNATPLAQSEGLVAEPSSQGTERE